MKGGLQIEGCKIEGLLYNSEAQSGETFNSSSPSEYAEWTKVGMYWPGSAV